MRKIINHLLDLYIYELLKLKLDYMQKARACHALAMKAEELALTYEALSKFKPKKGSK